MGSGRISELSCIQGLVHLSSAGTGLELESLRL